MFSSTSNAYNPFALFGGKGNAVEGVSGISNSYLTLLSYTGKAILDTIIVAGVEAGADANFNLTLKVTVDGAVKINGLYIQKTAPSHQVAIPCNLYCATSLLVQAMRRTGDPGIHMVVLYKELG